LGPDEVAQSMVSLKDLRGGIQQLVTLDQAAAVLKSPFSQ